MAVGYNESNINKINVSLLDSYENDFSKEYSTFNVKTYNALNANYLSYCSDPLIRIMYKTLHNHLLKIQRGYSNIDSWWKDYNENVRSLENYLSDNGSIGSILEPSVRNFASKLPILENYNANLCGFINPMDIAVAFPIESKSIFSSYINAEEQILIYESLSEKEKISIFKNSMLDLNNPIVKKTIENILNSKYDENFLSIIAKNNFLDDKNRMKIIEHLTGKQINFLLSQDVNFVFPKTFSILSSTDNVMKTIDVSILINLLYNEKQFKLFQENFNQDDIFVDNIKKGDIIKGFGCLRTFYGSLRYNYIPEGSYSTTVYIDFFERNLYKTLILENLYVSEEDEAQKLRELMLLEHAQKILKDKYDIEVSNEAISNIKSNSYCLSNAEFFAFIGLKNVMAFNTIIDNKNVNVYNADYPDMVLEMNQIHESMHFLTRKSSNETGFSYNSNNVGFNEAATQLITKFILGESYSNVYTECAYENATIGLKIILDLNIDGLDEKTFVQAYFNNDLESIKKVVNELTGKRNFFEDQLSPIFDEAIAGDSTALYSVALYFAILADYQKGKQ